MPNQYLVAAIASTAIALVSSAVYHYFFRRKVLLQDSSTKYSVKLNEKHDISPDTRRFRFSLPDPSLVLGLPCGQHIYLSTKINNKLVVRPYTPTTKENTTGYFDLVIKVYKAGVHPKFPEGGKMSQFLDSMTIGESIDIRGPSGNLVYQGNGVLTVKRGKNFINLKKKEIGLIAGGTGITPMYQMIRKVLDSKTDNTKLSLLFANQTVDDILLRKQLSKYEKQYPDRLKVWFTLDRKPESEKWDYDIGFVNEDMIKRVLPAPGPNTMILTCGPPPMVKFAVLPNLEKIGFGIDEHYEY